METIVYYGCLCYIVFLNFHHGRRRTHSCLYGGKDQGTDGNVGYPPPQEWIWRLGIQQCKYASDTNRTSPWTEFIQRLIQRNQRTRKQHQQWAQWIQIDNKHKKERRARGIKSVRWYHQDQRQHSWDGNHRQQRRPGQSRPIERLSPHSNRNQWRGCKGDYQDRLGKYHKLHPTNDGWQRLQICISIPDPSTLHSHHRKVHHGDNFRLEGNSRD